MSDDLLPCPFCGSQGVATSYVIEGAVRCTGCGVSITRRHPPTGEAGYEQAIAAWNRRAIPATDAREKALREAAAVVLPENDMVWRSSWYEPALRAAQARILALIDKPAPDARADALREAAEAWQAFKAANTTTDHFNAVERLDAILIGEARHEHP